jgi:hypothetical protein
VGDVYMHGIVDGATVEGMADSGREWVDIDLV